MAERVHRWFGILLWRGLMVAVVLLAIYVTGARMLLRSLPDYAPQIAAELSRVTQSTIQLETMTGRLRGFSPEIVIAGLTLKPQLDGGDVLSLDRAVMRLDIWMSLMALAPRFDAIELNRPRMEWFVSDQLITGRDDQADTPGIRFEDISELLQAFSRVSVTDGELLLTRVAADGSEISVPLLAQLELGRVGSERRVRARLSSPEGILVTIAGQGIGNPFAANASRGELHGTVSAENLGALGQLFEVDVSGSGSLDFWYQPVGGFPTWRVVADLESLELDAARQQYGLASLSTSAAIERNDTGWQLSLQDTRIVGEDAALTINRLQASQDDLGWSVRSSEIDTSAAVATLLGSGALPEGAVSALTTLAPSGIVDRLEARVDKGASFDTGWWLKANVTDATTQPLLGVPGLYGIDAYIDASADGATAWIDTEDFGLDLPRVYHDPIFFDRVLGRLGASWEGSTLFLEAGVLEAQSALYDAKVQFAMDIPLRKGIGPPLAMYLTVGVPDADAGVRQQFIPKTVDSGLYSWLEQAIPQGRIADTSFVWRGDLRRWNVPRQTMQLALSLADAEVAFQPDWPPLKDLAGVVLIDDARIGVWSDRARVLSAAASETSVEVRARRSGTYLEATTSVDAGVDGVLDLLSQTPINDQAGVLIADLDGAGQLNGTLALGMDIAQVEESLEVTLDVDVSNGALTSQVLDLSIDDIQGQLGFELGRGFSSRNLHGRALGADLTLDIDPSWAGEGVESVFAGRFTGTPAINELADWINPPVGLPLSGSPEITVDVVSGTQTSIRIHSLLEGMMIDLPAPIGKSAEAATPMEIKFALGNDSPADVFWQDRLSAQLYRIDGSVVGGSFDLTPRQTMLPPPEPSITSGYYVMGTLDRIDIEPWLAAIGRIDFPENFAGEQMDISIEAMEIREVLLGEATLGPVAIDLTPFAGWEMLGLNADWLDAELALQHDGSNTALIINTLDLDRLPDFGSAGESANADINPPNLTAPVDVVLANLTFEEEQLGAASFTLESDGIELQLNDLRGRLANIFFEDNSSFSWQTNPDGHLSTLTLSSRLGDVGDTLDQLGSPRILETRRGTLQANLSWADTPINPGVANLSGDLALELREGSFLPVSGQATGAMRILSLLNLAGLVRRANVNQLFEPGVTFDAARGDLLFSDGLLAIPDFVVEGSGGNFVFDSDIDLLEEKIEGELVVTLPLANNIPWVAALAGGLPIAAGAYILSRVFEDQVNSLSSGVYSVNGPLNAPDVKFERIFDAKSKQSRARAEASVTVE